MLAPATTKNEIFNIVRTPVGPLAIDRESISVAARAATPRGGLRTFLVWQAKDRHNHLISNTLWRPQRTGLPCGCVKQGRWVCLGRPGAVVQRTVRFPDTSAGLPSLPERGLDCRCRVAMNPPGEFSAQAARGRGDAWPVLILTCQLLRRPLSGSLLGRWPGNAARRLFQGLPRRNTRSRRLPHPVGA